MRRTYLIWPNAPPPHGGCNFGQGKSWIECYAGEPALPQAPSATEIRTRRSQKVELTLFNHIERHYLKEAARFEEPTNTDTSMWWRH